MAVLIKDLCGIFCIIMTYGALVYADYAVVRWIVVQTMADSLWGIVHAVLFNVIILLSLMAHACAVFSDPGIVPQPQNRIDISDDHDGGGSSTPPGEDWTICSKCEMYRPPRAYHCKTCKHCIRKMDHHCPWINNCVGEKNQKFFIQFLIYVGLLSGYAISLVAWSWYMDCSDCPQDIQIKHSRILHSVFLSLESVVFGMLVIAVACDQFKAIFSDETMVEQVKGLGPYRPEKAKMELLAEVFGTTHWLLWLLPCPTARKAGVDPSANYDV